MYRPLCLLHFIYYDWLRWLRFAGQMVYHIVWSTVCARKRQPFLIASVYDTISINLGMVSITISQFSYLCISEQRPQSDFRNLAT